MSDYITLKELPQIRNWLKFGVNQPESGLKLCDIVEELVRLLKKDHGEHDDKDEEARCPVCDFLKAVRGD